MASPKTSAVAARGQRAAERASKGAGAAAPDRGPFSGHESLSPEQVGAIEAYQEGSYGIINAHLRGNYADPLPSTTRRTLERLDSAIGASRTTRPTAVYRGYESDVEISPAALVGTRISDPGFTSTSTKRLIAEGFAGYFGKGHSRSGPPGYLLKIKLPAGSKALNVYEVKTGSQFGRGGASPEFEVLLARGTNLRITSAKKNRRGLIIAIAEIVP